MRGSSDQLHEESDTSGLSAIVPLRREMTCATDGGMRAGRVKDRQIPRVIDHVKDVTLIMRTLGTCCMKIARQDLVTTRKERVTDGTLFLAADKNVHFVILRNASLTGRTMAFCCQLQFLYGMTPGRANSVSSLIQ
jgi:hypothetical protein